MQRVTNVVVVQLLNNTMRTIVQRFNVNVTDDYALL